VSKLFRTLILHPKGQDIVDVYVDGLYRNYLLEDCIKESLQSFLDSKKSEKIEAAIRHALYVPLLHGLLNGGDAAIATSLGERCVTGILTALFTFPNRGVSRPRKERVFLWSEFVMACKDCVSILLPYACHYSTDLVNLLLEQQRKHSPLPGIRLKAAMVGPYLEQFEHHVDATPELKAFLVKRRASKPPSTETADGPTDSTSVSSKHRRCRTL